VQRSRLLGPSFAAWLLAGAACACNADGAAPPSAAAPHAVASPLIVVSLDGFRPDYLERFEAPALGELAREGLHAKEGMIPVFPTKTFPSHYSIVTGLYPSHHGIVSNTFHDPQLDAWFKLSDAATHAESRWWGGEPIWVTAGKHGLRSATMFWIGSEAEIGGMRPTYWVPYDGSLPGADRVDRVLDWLDLPPAERPALVLLYFSEVDSAGHRHGPEAPEVRAAVRRVDGYVRRLVDGLAARGLRESANLIVLSDHGMTSVSPERVIVLEDYIDVADAMVVDPSPVLMLRPKEGKLRAVHDALAGAHPRLRVFYREELPARLHFTGHERIPPLVGIADEGWTVQLRREREGRDFPAGMHGYDNRLESMRALFVARGPAFRRGTVAPFEAVHAYELMAAVLGVEAAPNDGDPTVARGLLAGAVRMGRP
jgi:predicted AlkP superfamily pyrophosphatase or phosphodiesterase